MDKTIEEEFNNKKDCIIYLDWNIISYFMYPDSLSGDMKNKMMCLEYVMLNILNIEKCLFPYSHAHFLDIRQGNEKFIDEKLKFLYGLSKGWKVTEGYHDREILNYYKTKDIHSDYFEYDEHLKQSHDESEKNNNSMLPLQNVVKAFIGIEAEKHNQNEDQQNNTSELLECIFPGNDPQLQLKLLKYNKKNRHNIKDNNGDIIKYPELSSTKIAKSSEELKKMVNKSIEKSDFPYKPFNEFSNSISLFDSPHLSNFHNDVQKLSALAEFIGISSEKLKKVSSFGSITNDSFHLNYGLRCKFFILEDKNLFSKAQFIKKWNNLDVLVCDIDNFITNILYDYLLLNLKNDPDFKKEKKYTFEYDFHDKDGNFIRKYKIKIIKGHSL